jgi:hypothetical protein
MQQAASPSLASFESMAVVMRGLRKYLKQINIGQVSYIEVLTVKI